jgi:hypothetical protein
MPWYKGEVSARSGMDDENKAETRGLLEVFSKDYNFTRKRIRLARTAPRGFPDVEWDHIIRGEPVDLDVVFSSLHHIAPVKENTGHVGWTEISLGKTEPARKIKTSGEWTSAWNSTAKATAFAFPHQGDELRKYGEYMDSEFSAKAVSAHHKLIAFDKAVRHHVMGGQAVALTERESFSFIYSAFLLPDGVEANTGQRGDSISGNKLRKKSSEICRRYNSPEGCSTTSTNCRYRHACEKCKQAGHGKGTCSQ